MVYSDTLCPQVCKDLLPPASEYDQPPCLCSYLHSCTPPIIHGNLTTDTIFIQHNGLIKIGSGENLLCIETTPLQLFIKILRYTVAPDAIYNHVKTFKQEQRNMHYIAPEYAGAFHSHLSPN